MHRPALLAFIAPMLLVLSGCAASDDGKATDPVAPVTDDPYAALTALVADLPCQATSVGAETSDNLRLVANATFGEGGGSGDIDVRGDLLLANPGILDISDPLAPRQVVDFAEFDIASGGDAKWMPDNRSAVVGGGAVTLINLATPSAPFAEDVWELSEYAGPLALLPETTLNAHMLYAARIAGDDWVFVAPNDNNGVWILRVEGEAPERHLEYVAQTLPIEGGPLGPHDMFVGVDPFTGDWYLYSADGFHGWAVFNVNDPANPMLVGGLLRPETGYTHTIQSAKVGERRIVATIQEVGDNLLEVYDATNLAAPVLLATWQVAPGETTPQHNLNIVNGTLYVAHYSYGMYVFDLQTLPAVPLGQVAQMQPVGHYDPVAGGVSHPVPLAGGEFQAFYDVVVQDGILYGSGFSDPVIGIHVLAYGCNRIGDPTLLSMG